MDAWLPDFRGADVALEFKYDRSFPSGNNAPRTQRAGAIFMDLHKLLLCVDQTNVKGVFIYVATVEMTAYLKNPSNGLRDLFELPSGSTLRIDERLIQGRATTFQKAAGQEFSATLTGLLAASLGCDHVLRAYEVAELKNKG